MLLAESALLLAVVLTTCHVAHSADCVIKINSKSLTRPQPLILKTGVGVQLNAFGFHLPDDAGNIRLPVGTVIRLACVGADNHFDLYMQRDKKVVRYVEATCAGGTDFNIFNAQQQYTEMFCKQNPVHSAVTTADLCAAGSGVKIHIGFQVETDFFHLIENCFDTNLLNPLWSKYELVKEIKGTRALSRRPSFLVNPFYLKEKMDTLFEEVTQKNTFDAILGIGESGKYISTNNLLNRGHLAAAGDFVHASQKRATFYYLNVAPQWTTVNVGNWGTLERNLQAMASSKKLDLQVYTGTYGTLTLQAKQIYLHYKKHATTDIKRIPVPELFWKVVYDPKSKLAAAFMTLNNPHVTDDYATFLQHQTICPDECAKITWNSWKKKNEKTKGYSFCCDVIKFRNSVTSLPQFEVKGLLV